MAHRGQWSEHEARGVLSAWRKSGHSLERFAKERGLVPQRIRWWKAKLEGKTTALVRSKTAAGRRRLLIPDELAPYLVAIAGDRPGDAPLFVSEASRRWSAGRRWSRHMAYNHVRRICAAAKVPTLPPQALRRTQATLATDAGATGLMVAQHLGHATGAAPAVTHRSYVERDAARDAAVQRGLRVLQGGRQRPVPDPGSVETTVETDPNRGEATMAK